MRRLDDLCEYACTCISQDLTSEAAVSWYSGGFPLFFFTALLPGSNASKSARQKEGGKVEKKKIRCAYPCSDTESETDLCEVFV